MGGKRPPDPQYISKFFFNFNQFGHGGKKSPDPQNISKKS